MRNNNADIVIHSLIERHANRSKIYRRKYDHVEETALKEKEREKLRIISRNELKIEEKGYWVRILYDHLSYTLLITPNHTALDTIAKFLEKLNKRI